jgi:hypothetical protein
VIQAAAQGLTVQDWLKKLAYEAAESTQFCQPFKSACRTLVSIWRSLLVNTGEDRLRYRPVTAEIVEAMIHIPRADIPDMPDRIVAATAIYFGAAHAFPKYKRFGEALECYPDGRMCPNPSSI